MESINLSSDVVEQIPDRRNEEPPPVEWIKQRLSEAWLRAGEGEGHFHGPGAWPFGIHAYAGREDNDLILWLPSINAIVTGDSLSDFGDGLEIQLGGRKHATRDDVARRLRPLLDLPVELVLPAHGAPTDRAALESVLS